MSVSDATPDPKLLESVYRQLSVGIVLYEAVDGGEDFRVIYMNPAAMRLRHIHGGTSLRGALISEAFPGAPAMGMIDAVSRVHRSGMSESMPAHPYRDDALCAWFRTDLFRLDSGQVLAIFVDATTDVEAELALQDSRTRYDLLTQSMADGIYDWDLDQNRLYLSPVWKGQLGYADDELDNSFDTFLDLLHPDHRERVTRQLQAYVSGASDSWDLEFQLRHKDGRYVWIHSRGTSIRDALTGEVTRVLGVHIDIDQRKRVQDEAKRQRQSLEAVFDAIPDLFFLLDSDGIIEDFHAGSHGDLFRRPETLLGKSIAAILPDGVSTDLLSAMQEARITQELVTIEYELDVSGGTEHYEGRIRHLEDGRFALIVRRISDRKRVERAMEERVRELDALYQIHRISQVTHEREELVRKVTPIVANAMQKPMDVVVELNIDDIEAEYGNTRATGKRIVSPIFDGGSTRGKLMVRFNERTPPTSEEQSFLNATSLSLGLWLQNDNAHTALETFEKIVANTQDQLALLDAQLNYRLANGAYAARVGCRPEELVDRSVEDVLGPYGFGPAQRQNLERALRGSVVQYREWRSTPDGKRYMNVLYSPHVQHGDIVGIIVSIHDITDLHEALGQLRRAARVFSNSGEAVLMTDADGRITDVNPAFTHICGYSSDEACERGADLISSERHDGKFFEEIFTASTATGRWRGEVWCRRSNGEEFPSLMTVCPVEDEFGAVSGFVGVFSDITQIKDNEQRLEILANHDPLTGLTNRAELGRYLESRVGRATEQEDSFTVLFIDLDRFKSVNDTLGHSAGDRLLCEVTRRLHSVLRASDLMARIGGDEFVVVLSGIDTRANASVIAEKILASLTAPFTLLGQRVQISASIGICFYPDDGNDAETLLRNADTAMYKAKDSGRGAWRCYAAEMTEQAQRHMLVLGDLADARHQGELYLCYQATYALPERQIAGLEALMRWTHPTLGNVTPSEFIPVAEHGGLIRDLDYWTLGQVCQQLAQWRQGGLDAPRVSVNISERTLADDDFVERVAKLLVDNDLTGSSLCLEVPERALHAGDERMEKLLEGIRALEIGVAIDDFGAGYTSLAYLSRLPLTELKIDVSLIAELGADSRSEAVVSAIGAMCRHLDISIVAEGVETQGQHEFISSLAPVFAQGYLYSRPSLPEAIEEMLIAETPLRA
ncbi:MAG: EAL domain-containing protein [Pseudomonadota bacterium]